MTITNCTPADIDRIFELYRAASAYQKTKKTVVVWPEFDQSMVETEIAENRQWKIVNDNGLEVCLFATTHTDEQIWEEKNADKAVYIHRICIDPQHRGANYVGVIVAWAKQYAYSQGLDYVRLDTLGHNTKLIEHYTRNGFEFLGMFNLKNTDQLPAHYQGVPAALFQIKIES